MGDYASDLARIRGRLKAAAATSGMTQEEIGVAMGFAPSGARQAVSRLLNENEKLDPRLTTLAAFARAIGKELREIV